MITDIIYKDLKTNDIDIYLYILFIEYFNLYIVIKSKPNQKLSQKKMK